MTSPVASVFMYVLNPSMARAMNMTAITKTAQSSRVSFIGILISARSGALNATRLMVASVSIVVWTA